jgi:flagellar assembly protein FliH
MGRIVKGSGHVVPAVVMDARAEAERIVAAARAQAAETLEDARRAGFERGRAEGVAALASVLAAGRAEARAMLARVEPDALAIATRMAEKIVGRAVELDPAIMADITAEAVAACRTRDGVIRLRVHPDDLPAVASAHGRLAERLGGEGTLEVEPDETVERFGCVVETPVGRVDARLATQLEALRAALGPAGREEVARG